MRGVAQRCVVKTGIFLKRSSAEECQAAVEMDAADSAGAGAARGRAGGSATAMEGDGASDISGEVGLSAICRGKKCDGAPVADVEMLGAEAAGCGAGSFVRQLSRTAGNAPIWTTSFV